MNRKLSDWASIAEIVSGIAVVITLVFLLVGLRENTAVTRAAAFDRNIDSVNHVAMAIAQDAELMRLFQFYQDESLDINELSREEWARVRAIIRSLMRIYETAYFSSQYGILGSSEWSRFERQICSHRELMDTARWNEIERLLTADFSDFIERGCRVAP